MTRTKSKQIGLRAALGIHSRLPKSVFDRNGINTAIDDIIRTLDALGPYDPVAVEASVQRQIAAERKFHKWRVAGGMAALAGLAYSIYKLLS